MGWLTSLRQWLCRRLGCGADDKVDRLLRHFLLLLNDEFIAAKTPSGEEAVVNPAVAGRIEELSAPKQPADWERAYEIERLLVLIKPRGKLLIDADRRVAEAESLKLSAASKYRAQLESVNTRVLTASTVANSTEAAAAAATGENQAQLKAAADRARERAKEVNDQADRERRAILSAAVDDLQWFYQQRILKRTALWASARNLVAFGFATILIVAIPFFAFVSGKLFGPTKIVEFIKDFPNYGMFTAMSFGLLGAFFSRLISLQFATEMTVEDAENRYGITSLFIRGAVGMCGAAIIYFLLGTELLGQTVKPDFTKLSFQPKQVVTMLSKHSLEVLLPSANWCLLIIWSFLAGFSERLVPESLARAEGQVTGTQKQP